MAESYSVQAVLSVSDESFTSKMSGAVKTVNQLDNTSKKTTSSLTDIVKGVGSFKAVTIAADALKNSLSGAISRFDTLNQYPKVMQQIGFSAEASDASVKRLSEGIDGLPTSLDGIVASTQNIAVLTRDIDKATETSIALNDAFLASGSATADAERGLTQYVQMLSKGKVDMQSWRTLQETMGPALYEVADAFGYAGASAQNDLYEALKDGVITFDQFNDKLIELDGGVNGFAERARTASAGVATSFQNLKTAVVRGMEKVIRAADTSLSEAGLPNFQQSLELTKTGVNETFAVATDATEKFVKIAAPGVKLVADNLDSIIPVLGTAAVGFVAYKAAMDISDKVKKFTDAKKKAVEIIKAATSAEKLEAKATELREKATKMAREADLRSTLAQEAQEKALRAKTTASRLATDATKAQKAADQAAEKIAKAKNVTAEMSAKAEELKADAEKKAAIAANAQAQAEKKAAVASKAKDLAERTSTASTNLNTMAEEANTAAEGAGTTAAQVSSAAIAVKTAVLGVLSKEMTVAEAVQYAWNTAMEANPIGAVIVAITAAIGVIVALTKIIQKVNEKNETFSYRQKKSKEATKELTESLEESKEAYEDTYKETKNSTGAVWELAKKTVMLANNTNRNAADTALLKSNIETLNDSVEGLNLAYDEQTGKLNMTDNAMLSLVDAYKKQAEAEIYAERYKEILEEQLAVDEQLAEAEGLLEEAQGNLNAQTEYGSSVSAISVWQMEKQKKAVEELQTQKDSLAQQEQEVTDQIAACQLQATQATQEAADAQIASNESVRINLENLSDEQKDTLDRIVEAYETMTGSLSSLNDKIEEDDDLTWSQVKKNQEDTIAKTQEFADLYTQLINAGVSESYLNAIGATGPEALPLLKGMMNDGINAVLDSQAEWESAYDSINKTFTDGMKLSDEDRAILRDYISGESGVFGTLESAIQAAGFSEMVKETTDEAMQAIPESIENALPDIRPLAVSMAKDTLSGYTEGMADTSGVAAAGTNMAEVGIDAAKKAQDSNSPSKVYKGLGGDAIDGYILGLETKQNSLNSTMQKLMNSAGKTAVTALNSSMQAMSVSSTASFTKISAAARNGMRVMTTEVTSGSRKSNTVMQSGMKSMNAVTQSGMTAMRSSTVSGMNSMALAISNGMVQARLKVTNGGNNMVSALSSLESKFFNSGYYASLGLARGINAGSGNAIVAARRLANSVSATINNALKIHSPSDVTEESGEFTTEGLIEGMLSKINAVRNAAGRIAEAAVPTGNIARLVAQAGEYAVNTLYSYVGNVDATYTIVVPLEIDGREFARATASYTQDELDRKEKLGKYIKGYR